MRCNKIRLISFLGFLVILLVSFNVFLLSKLNSVSGEGYLIRFKVSQLGWSLMVFLLERKSRPDDEKFGSLRDMYVRPFLLVLLNPTFKQWEQFFEAVSLKLLRGRLPYSYIHVMRTARGWKIHKWHNKRLPTTNYYDYDNFFKKSC